MSFCTACAAPNRDDAQFCSSCGQSLYLQVPGERNAPEVDVEPEGRRAPQSETEPLRVLPHSPEHLAELRKCKEHVHLLCLHCGFHGLMGVERTEVPWYGSWWFIIPLFLTGIGIFGVIGLAFLISANTKKFVRCPNCKRQLVSQGGGKVFGYWKAPKQKQPVTPETPSIEAQIAS